MMTLIVTQAWIKDDDYLTTRDMTRSLPIDSRLKAAHSSGSLSLFLLFSVCPPLFLKLIGHRLGLFTSLSSSERTAGWINNLMTSHIQGQRSNTLTDKSSSKCHSLVKRKQRERETAGTVSERVQPRRVRLWQMVWKKQQQQQSEGKTRVKLTNN